MTQGKQKPLTDMVGQCAGLIQLEQELRKIDPTARAYWFIHDCVHIECSEAKALEVREAADKFILDELRAPLLFPLGVVGTLCPRCRAGHGSEEHNLCGPCYQYVTGRHA